MCGRSHRVCAACPTLSARDMLARSRGDMSFNLRDGNDVALPMLLVVLILGYGIFTSEPRLQSKRQAAAASAVAVSAQAQEIPSRLWQDPLVGIAEAAK